MQAERIRRSVELLRHGNLGATLDNHRRVRRGQMVRLLPNPMPNDRGTSARRVNSLLRGMPSARRYLEVGLLFGATFQQIQVPHRVGVDPAPRFDLDRLPKHTVVFPVTSDEYFAHASADERFDLVFLDGLHTYRQTYVDLVNALRVCPSGVILIDDVVPIDEISAIADQSASLAERASRQLPGHAWHGDVYKVMLCIRDHHPELRVRTIMGSGNPQALVWLPDGATPGPAADEASLDALAAVSFAEVLADGPPTYFRPCTETAGIADALEEVSERFAD